MPEAKAYRFCTHVQGSEDPCSLPKNKQQPGATLSFEELLRDLDASALVPAPLTVPHLPSLRYYISSLRGTFSAGKVRPGRSISYPDIVPAPSDGPL